MAATEPQEWRARWEAPAAKASFGAGSSNCEWDFLYIMGTGYDRDMYMIDGYSI